MFQINLQAWVNAKKFSLRIKVDLIDVHKNKLKFGEIEKFSPLENIEISPKQIVPFDLSNAVFFSDGWEMKDADLI